MSVTMLKKSSTKDIILKTAEKFFAKDGYMAVSINKIAKTVNVAKSSIYHFFENKQDLYFQVLTRSFEEIDAILQKEVGREEEVNKKIYNIIVAYLDFGIKNKNLFCSIIQKASNSEKEVVKFIAKLRKKLISHFEKVIQVGVNKNILHITDSKLSAYLLVGTMDSFLMDNVLAREKGWSSQQVAEQIVQSLFGLRGKQTSV